MEFNRYKKIVTLTTDKDVNQYINLGWELIFVGQFNDGEYQGIEYVVGWMNNIGEPIDPPSSYKQL